MSLGNRVQDPNTGNATLLQACTLRRERGGSSGSRGRCAPTPSASRRSPAGAACSRTCSPRPAAPTRRGRSSTTSRPTDFRGIPLDGIWLGAVAYLAETAAALGDPTHAAALHDLLEPYADRNVAVGWASTCTGSAARHLGLLAGLLGRRKPAIAYFETALAMNERMRARPWVARTQIEFARLLSEQPAGRDRAAELLEAGLAEAQRLGMPRLVELGERVRAGAAVTPRA